MNITQQFEICLIKANEPINKEKYEDSLYTYNFLLEKVYKKGIIYMNIGVCYFKTGNYEKALENFFKSKNETRTADVYLYTAYTYYKTGNIKQAIKELEQGLAAFKQDKGLQELHAKLKGPGEKNEKNTGSINKQR